jgi:choline dehydrogenase-like flavoprotein
MKAEHSVASSRSPAGNRRSVTVIGGGLGGLVAAIRCAEQGVPVTLHEARRQLGGRARSTAPPFVANDGPHGLYADGITWQFLLDRRVAVPTAMPPAGGSRFHVGGRIRRMLPRAMLRAFRGMRRPAPVESDPGLRWPSGTCAVFDVGLRRRRGDPWVVCDTDEVTWIERFSRTDRTLAPPAHELLQTEIGIRPGDTLDAALQRLHTTLDAAYPQWRTRLVWSRQARQEAVAGAVDHPGATWRDRPRIDRGQDVFLATDMSAVPGLLSEVSVASALTAADHAVAAYRAKTSRSRDVR